MRRFPVSREVKRIRNIISGRVLPRRIALHSGVLIWILSCAVALAADESTQQELRELRQENRLLRERLDKQQQVIDSLSTKVANIEQTQKGRDEMPSGENASGGSVLQKLSGQAKVNISGQLAAALFKTGSEGMFPNTEFRLDEARLFLEARAWEDVYAYVEINGMTRESDETLRLGEAYIDLERIVKWRGLDSLVNLRLGRFYTPFGEEYQVRYPMDNPLITHSLSDLWGYDNGLELYGSHNAIQYALAVQNGGISSTRDFTEDKTVAARLAYQPANWLRVSGSAMRTGNLSDRNDPVSSTWFGNAFFRSLGNPATTTHYHADVAEGDVQFLFSRGHLKLTGGGIHYDDNDRSADNSRDVYYYAAEGMFRFTKQFFGATRYSQILADKGFPILGNGMFDDYFYDHLSANVWRLSFGLGYTPNPNLVFKIECALERGHTIDGEQRSHTDFFGAQAALRF